MTPEETDQLLAEFRRATLNLFRATAQAYRDGLPFTVRIDDRQGANLLHGIIERTPEGLAYSDVDDTGVILAEHKPGTRKARSDFRRELARLSG